jgi:hypothetical protein
MKRWPFFLFALLPGLARADVVPDPPTDCPPGQVGVTSHHGAKCTPAAPKDCPPGYYGEVGGHCVPFVCARDDRCAELAPELVSRGWLASRYAARDWECRTVDLCFQPYDVPAGPSWGESPVPAIEWIAVGICQRSGDCASPGECRPDGVCLVRGTPTSAAPSLPHHPKALGAAVGRPGGCGRGCALAARSSIAFGGFAVAMMIGVAWLRRARSRRRERDLESKP